MQSPDISTEDIKSLCDSFYFIWVGFMCPLPFLLENRARICKRLRSPGIDSEESILRNDSASLFSRVGRYDKGYRTGPPG